jgi:LacI family transcriptional regulator
MEKEIVENIIHYNFSGVIASLSIESKDSNHFRKLIEHNIKLVMFDRVSEELDVPKVVINNSEIIAKAVQILVDKNYRRITYISGPKNFSVFGERQSGYKTAIQKNKLLFYNQITNENGFNNINASKLLDDIIKERPHTDAIICDSTILANQLLNELFKRKIKIPEEIAIIVFGESPIMDLLMPPITTINQPTEQIAKKILELLEAKLLHPNSPNKKLQLSAEIRIKSSI